MHFNDSSFSIDCLICVEVAQTRRMSNINPRNASAYNSFLRANRSLKCARDVIVPYNCVDCGYIELYRKLKKKE